MRPIFQTLLILIIFIEKAWSRPTDGLTDFHLLNYSPIQILLSRDEDLDISDQEIQKIPPKCLEDDMAHIEFQAYNRNFSLRLQKVCEEENEVSEELLTGDFIEFDKINKSVVYFQGYLEGESNSTVDGSIKDGVFQGVIITEDRQKYIIERLDSPVNGFHSLIFQIQSKQQIIATLFDFESSGENPNERFLTVHGRFQQEIGEIEGSGNE